MPRDAEIGVRQNRTPQDTEVNNPAIVVGAQPITQHNSIQSDKASRLAEQLSGALGVGKEVAGGIYQKQQAADTALGQEDAQVGITKENPSAAYASAQDHVHALASWAVDGDRIGTDVQKMGFDQNPDAKQGLADMNTWLNQQFSTMYNGSSKTTMDTLTPKMAELRNNANSWFQKSVVKQVNDKQQGDLKTIAGSAFAKAFEPDATLPDNGGTFNPSKFDYEGLNKNFQSLYPGQDGNKLIMGQLADIAETKGVPNLLTSMPDRWADGTPTPKGSGDPATINAFRSAVKKAQAQQNLFLGATDAYNADAQKAIVKQTEVTTMDKILSGRDVTSDLHAYARMPGADAKFIEGAANWQHERFKQGEDDAVDGSAAAKIQHDIGMGTVTSAGGILQAVNDSGISGKAKVQVTQKMLGMLKDVQTTTQDDPATKMYLQSLEAKYKPSTDALGKFDHPAAAQQQADLLLDFRRQAMQPNADIKSIYDSVQKKYGDPIDADKTMPKTTLTPVNDAERSQILKSRNNGKFNATAFNGSGMTADDVRRLQRSGQISDDDATEAAKVILARHNK